MYKLFKYLINDLRQDEVKNKVIKKYEKKHGRIKPNIKKNVFWEEYLSKFEIPEDILNLIDFPISMNDDLDWSLLVILIASSFSVEYMFFYSDLKIKIQLNVKSSDKCQKEELHNLLPWNAKAMFNLYLEEQLAYANLAVKSDSYKRDILQRRNKRIDDFNKQMSDMLNYVKDDSDDICISEILNEECILNDRNTTGQEPLKADTQIDQVQPIEYNCQNILKEWIGLDEDFIESKDFYEQHYESLDNDIRDMHFYKYYFAQIPLSEHLLKQIVLPKLDDKVYDWEVVIRLLMGYHRYFFERDDEGISIIILATDYMGRTCRYLDEYNSEDIDLLMQGICHAYIGLYHQSSINQTVENIMRANKAFIKTLAIRHQLEISVLQREVSNQHLFTFEGVRYLNNGGQTSMFLEDLISKYEASTHSTFNDFNFKNNILWSKYLCRFSLRKKLFNQLLLYQGFDWKYFIPMLLASVKVKSWVKIRNKDNIEIHIRHSGKDNLIDFDYEQTAINEKQDEFMHRLYYELLLEHLSFIADNDIHNIEQHPSYHDRMVNYHKFVDALKDLVQDKKNKQKTSDTFDEELDGASDLRDNAEDTILDSDNDKNQEDDDGKNNNDGIVVNMYKEDGGQDILSHIFKEVDQPTTEDDEEEYEDDEDDEGNGKDNVYKNNSNSIVINFDFGSTKYDLSYFLKERSRLKNDGSSDEDDDDTFDLDDVYLPDKQS